MKLTKTKLKQLIKEELDGALYEEDNFEKYYSPKQLGTDAEKVRRGQQSVAGWETLEDWAGSLAHWERELQEIGNEIKKLIPNIPGTGSSPIAGRIWVLQGYVGDLRDKMNKAARTKKYSGAGWQRGK